MSEQLKTKAEIFFSVSYDRNRQMPVITYSKHGGMIGGIEEIEALYPETINRIYINFQTGLKMEDTYEITKKLGISMTMHSKLLFILKNLYECFK